MKIGVIFYHSNITLSYPRKWIDDCVNSILNQSHKKIIIYELNYGDDGFKIHKEYEIEGEYHYYQQKFSNHVEAMNFLLKKSIENGCDVVFNTNMDDNYHVDRIKIQLNWIKSGCDVVSSNFIHIDEEGNEIRKMTFSKMNISENLDINHNIIVHPVVCYSKKYIKENSYISSEIPEEDMLLWKRTCDKYKFHICDEYLLNYRLHNNQVSSSKSKQKKVGLLIIATNKYTDFLDDIISSADKYFLKDQLITYFIFSNKEIKINSGRPHVKIKVTHRDWPWMTLGRYMIFSNSSKILSKMDYLYYCDVDMKFVDIIGDEILGDLVSTQHPGHYGKRGSPEKDPNSLAYISDEEEMEYFAGGFNGGTSKNYLKMCKILSKNIEDDEKKGIIAVWHDESHLNRYLIDNKPTIVLTPSYCYSENVEIPFEKKLIALDKDHALYRGISKKVEPKVESKIEPKVEPKIEIIPYHRVESCICGEPKNKREYNFCQKCNKLY